MSSRIRTLEGVENFRDYGDYATAAGRRLAAGRLLRSGHHARATDADLQVMADHGLEVVVDLRRAGERREQPCRRLESLACTVIESDDQEHADAPHIQFLKTTDLTEDSVRTFMLEVYRDMPYDPRLVGLYRRYFEALAEAKGAVLIHCAAGKDRTGLLAALTHTLAGVSDDDLMEDYLLTNQAVRLQARAPEIRERLQRLYGRSATDAAVRAFLGVEPAFLAAAFAEIRARHGSLDAYLSQVLGIDAALRERVEARLLG
jgi:protein tyrosine/serine phosphatase